MSVLLVPLPGTETLAASIARKIRADIADMRFRQFPDGESYIRFLSSPQDRNIIVLAMLDRPDCKINRLIFTAGGARDLGARQVGLIAPYLPYMRQDKRFNSGEVITSASFAAVISTHFDWLMTVDPHLHRRSSLDEIYAIPSTVLQAAPLLAEWIKNHIANPVLIGPDSESEQWVYQVAGELGCPYHILSKTRHGDRIVEISTPDLSAWASATPVIIDDTISSAQTMIETVHHIRGQGLAPPVCCAVHGVFDDAALAQLKKAGPAQIITSNTVMCETSSIEISGLLADALQNGG